MKYFIDFEATQFTNEIISIGCVREDGNSFYALVKPKKPKAITPFITDLTGITKDMLENEKNSDEVFENFFDWLSFNNEAVEFYCYGNSDITFLKKNLKDRTSSLKAQAALSLIAMSLKDYSLDVKNHFGLIQAVSLKKVANYFYPNGNYLNHNALSDAQMLRDVYLGVEAESEVTGIPFPEHVGVPVFKEAADFKNFIIERINGGQVEAVYESLDEAIDYIQELLASQNSSAATTRERLGNRIMKAINGKNKYFNQKWVVKMKKGE